MSTRAEQRRTQHKRYKEDVEQRGKPFYPHAMFHDTVMSFVVVSVIAALAVIWYYDSSEEPAEEGAGILGPRYNHEADPGTINFIPRPDWYFYFLFYLLRIFKWPDSVILATIGIPTILLVLLISLPFLDVRRERQLLRRPVALVTLLLVAISMGVLTWKGGTVRESLASEVDIDEVVRRTNLPEDAVPGLRLFVGTGCISCHTYAGIGSPNLGAPDLTAEGRLGKGIEYQIEHLKCPSCTDPGSQMPSFAALPEDQLRELAVFLEASKGDEKG